MKTRAAADEGAVIDPHMAGQQTIVRHHNAVPENAVVPEMIAGHQKISVTNCGRAAFGAAAMDGAILPNRVAVSDLHETLRFRIET